MRILQVMPDFEMAGAQTMLENLAMELEKNKENEVEIISFYNKKCAITERLERNKIKIHYLGKINGLDFRMYFRIYNIIKTFSPEIIHTHRYALEYIIPVIKRMKNKNIKVIHTIHNLADKEVPKRLQKKQLVWFKMENVIPVAISEEIKKSVINLYKLSENEVPVIYNGINIEKCIPKTSYEFNNTVLHIGRFSEQKNHEELIDIFKECVKADDKIKLDLVGEGKLKKKIKNKVERMNLSNNVNFIGKIEEPYRLINEADIFVLPSKWEGMPMTVIEAMGTGIPIIAYNVGGLKDMIKKDESGILVNNSREFVEAILELKDNLSKRRSLGERALKYAQKFSSVEMSKKYQRLYKGGFLINNED